MHSYPRWKIVLIACVALFGVIFTLPNFIGRDGRDWVRENMPSWVPSQAVNLGLDLQGGSHILLDVDMDVVFADSMNGIADALRQNFREDGLRVRSVSATQDSVQIALNNIEDGEAIRRQIRALDPNLTIDTEDSVITITLTDTARRELVTNTLSQTIEIVRRRVDETGTNEPVIQRQGDRRVLVQLPGVDDPERIKNLLGKTAKLGFHLTDDRATRTGRGGAGALVLPMIEAPGQMLGVKRRAMITGEMLTNASTQFAEGMPVVSFRLDARGADRFCRLSRDNVGKPFAIVLDGEVISAPVLREPICGGAGQISGGFTVGEANDLALLLRAGALPAPLTIAEERSIGPSLGADSVAAGEKAALVGFAFIIIFMIFSFGTFGMISVVALTTNILLVFGILSSLQATLTLPGIAGIVLTIGMAVDANILIFERIREEYLTGRTVLSAINSGFNNAFSTIIDANITGLIAAILLFSFGTGPIKGFAVTLMIGILTTLFTAIMLTRFMIYLWSKKTGANDLPLAAKETKS
jgi:preprotein translocase subunit SecD